MIFGFNFFQKDVAYGSSGFRPSEKKVGRKRCEGVRKSFQNVDSIYGFMDL